MELRAVSPRKFAGNRLQNHCAQCGETIFLPEWSEYLDRHRVRHRLNGVRGLREQSRHDDWQVGGGFVLCHEPRPGSLGFLDLNSTRAR